MSLKMDGEGTDRCSSRLCNDKVYIEYEDHAAHEHCLFVRRIRVGRNAVGMDACSSYRYGQSGPKIVGKTERVRFPLNSHHFGITAALPRIGRNSAELTMGLLFAEQCGTPHMQLCPYCSQRSLPSLGFRCDTYSSRGLP
jgi:hypothetical protein